MHTIREIQARLIDLGRLKEKAPDGKSNIDGKFGELTLDAYNHYRASLGKGAVVQANPVELETDLWPDEQPPPKPAASNPITDYLTQLAIKALLANLKGTIPMTFLSGYKTYIIAVLMIGLAVAGLLGWTIPGVNSDPGTLIIAALGLITGRTATANVAAGK